MGDKTDEKADKGVGRALTLASRLHRARIGEELQELGLFPGQEAVIEALAGHGPMAMGELAERLGVRPPTVSKTITRLSAQGLVKRRSAGEGDGRLITVALTESGEEKAGLLSGIGAAVEKDMLAGLDGKERKRLRKALRKVTKNLAKASGRAAGPDEPEDDA